MTRTQRHWLAVALLWGLQGCGGSDGGDAGGTDAAAIDAASVDAASAADDTGTSPSPDASATTLYTRLGGNSGIRTVITDFVGRVVADPRINGYFLNSSVAGGRLIDCLVRQVGNATGGPETYPDPVGTTNGCRDMASAHEGLGISTTDFNDLVGHLVAALQAASVAEADITTITSVLGPMASDIVEDTSNDATVYQRVGRKPAIGTVVDNFITRVVGDARINGFFGSVNAMRLRTCLVRQVCSIDGPCRYGMEVESLTEPGVSPTNVCRGMMESHAGLRDTASSPITIDDINALVEDLTLELQAAGVTSADITAIGGALAPLCTQIVAGGTGCPSS